MSVLKLRLQSAQVVVAVLLESFYAARQQFKEQEARESAAESRAAAAKARVAAAEDAELARLNEEAVTTANGDPISAGGSLAPQGAVEAQMALKKVTTAALAAAELQLDPLLEKLAAGFDTAGSLGSRIDMLFDRSVADPTSVTPQTETLPFTVSILLI